MIGFQAPSPPACDDLREWIGSSNYGGGHPTLKRRLTRPSEERGGEPAFRLVEPFEKVERTGIEPVTSGLQSRRSPS